MTRRIPYDQQCASCGARRLPDNALCRRCWRRQMPYPKYIASGDGGSAAHTAPPVSRPYNEDEAEQDAILRELSRCMYCGFNRGHASDCAGYNDFIDLAEEYRSDADLPTELVDE